MFNLSTMLSKDLSLQSLMNSRFQGIKQLIIVCLHLNVIETGFEPTMLRLSGTEANHCAILYSMWLWTYKQPIAVKQFGTYAAHCDPCNFIHYSRHQNMPTSYRDIMSSSLTTLKCLNYLSGKCFVYHFGNIWIQNQVRMILSAVPVKLPLIRKVKVTGVTLKPGCLDFL